MTVRSIGNRKVWIVENSVGKGNCHDNDLHMAKIKENVENPNHFKWCVDQYRDTRWTRDY